MKFSCFVTITKTKTGGVSYVEQDHHRLYHGIRASSLPKRREKEAILALTITNSVRHRTVPGTFHSRTFFYRWTLWVMHADGSCTGV